MINFSTQIKFSVGTDDTKSSDLAKVIKFFTGRGVNFIKNRDDIPYNGITFAITNASEPIAITPLSFEINSSELISLHKLVKRTRISGSLIIQALNDAIGEMDSELLGYFIHRKGDDAMRVFESCVAYLLKFLKLHKIPTKEFSFANANAIVYTLGGYCGVKHTFAKMFEDIYAGKEPVYSPCNTCKYAWFDDKGDILCERYNFEIPGNMTARDIVSSYGDDISVNDDKMFTHHIRREIDECGAFKRRLK